MPTDTSKNHHFRLALFWALLGSLATLAVFPYSLALNPGVGQLPVPLPIVALASALQTGILLILLSWIGLRLGDSMGLDTPLARALVYRQPLPAISQSAIKAALIGGSIGGIVIMGLSVTVQPWMPPTTTATTLKIDLWKRFLASFYGGITEELLLRLFCMTLLAWLFWRIVERTKAQPSSLSFWLAICMAAILFGVGHLPAAASVWSLTPIVIARTLVLNLLPGILFGFLYWRWGLEYAIVSHFWADIVLHVIGGS